MALSESQCYTIINTPELSDIFNEMKIKKDLGMFALGDFKLIYWINWFLFVHFRTRWWKCTNRYVEKSNKAAVEWRTIAWFTYDHHSVRDAITKPHNQEAVVDLLGNCTKNNARWKITSGNDSCLRCIPKGWISLAWLTSNEKYWF